MRRLGNHVRAGLGVLLVAVAPALAFAGETISYSYDALGRLTVAKGNGAAGKTAIEYDPAGNRKTYVVTDASTQPRVSGGSFEIPEVNAHYMWSPFGPASFTGHSGVAGNGSAFNFAAAPDGDQVGFLESETAATITLAVTNLTPGVSHSAKFYFAARPDWGGGNPVTVSFNGIGLGTYAPGSTAFVLVTSQPFVPNATSGSLTFSSVAAPGYLATAIDKVQVQ